MADTPQSNLGYGKQSEATIDQANIAMRAMPWYQDQMRVWGQDPGHPTLSKSQSQQILKQAQANGYVVDEGNMEVDDHGNFNPKGHKLRNTLIVAGLAAATIATMGAAGAFSGAAAGASAGGSVAGGAGAAAGGLAPLASTAISPVGSLVAGGTGLAGLSAPAVAGTAGAVTTGSKLASLIGGVGKIGSALSGSGVDANGNPLNAPQSSAYANQADQLAKNRYLETPLNQAGPTTDKLAMQNMLRAGLVAKMPTTDQPLSVGGYALPSLAPSAAGTTFAQSMQDQLAKRIASGQPLTLSGVQAPTQEELDARARALDAAGIGKGINSTLTGIGNTIGQGVRFAQLGKGIYDTTKGFFT